MPLQPYIYHGANITFSGAGFNGTCTIRNGELLFYEGKQSTGKARFKVYDSGWEYADFYLNNSNITPNLDSRYTLCSNDRCSSGFIQHISSFNCDEYGLCAYGGSKYTDIRHESLLYKHGTMRNGSIPAGSDVAIGQGQGYTYGYDTSLIRIYGYWTPSGSWVETFDTYLSVETATGVGNYTINTY